MVKTTNEPSIPHGHKFDDGKPQMELIPPSAYILLAEIMTGGAKKYNENNWTGLKVSRIIGAGHRHLQLFLSGEDYDKDSGQHHLGHFLANLVMSMHIIDNFPSQDDRPYIEKADIETVDKKHIFNNSREITDTPQLTLIPYDVLSKVALEIPNLKIDNNTLKDRIDYILNLYLVSSMYSGTVRFPRMIAATMVLIHDVLNNKVEDDRIFKYLSSKSTDTGS